MSVQSAWKCIWHFVLIGIVFFLATTCTLVTYPNCPHLSTMSTTNHTIAMVNSTLFGLFGSTIANSTNGTAIPAHLQGPLNPYREWLNRMLHVLSEASYVS